MSTQPVICYLQYVYSILRERSCELTIHKLLVNICAYKNKLERKSCIEIDSENIRAP